MVMRDRDTMSPKSPKLNVTKVLPQGSQGFV